MVEVSTVLVGIIEILLHIWDVITYPVYALVQRPWRQRSKIEKTRARIVTHQATEITIRAVPMVNKICDEMKAYPEEINTMERLFNFSRKKFTTKACLGTREVRGGDAGEAVRWQDVHQVAAW
eukprot:TRINITY_DN2139_c0_g1_i1.p1 TRINITY_DN2139_c0_g1~~TRINITY_DN2139_c0_g1_i1.p1  ORF type:complete len:123 (-),score=35.32 TRINITY_DN2139_c0_g1_i1:47-415(-)